MTTSNATDQRNKLLEAIDTHARRGGISRDKAIASWYASTMLGIDEDDAIEAASVDGPEDSGCDLIYVDEDDQTVYVLQGFISQNNKPASSRKWNVLNTAATTVRNPMFFKQAGRNDIYEILKDVDIEAYSFVFGLISLAEKSDQIMRLYESNTQSKPFPKSSYIYEYDDTLLEKFLISQAAERTVRKDNLAFSSHLIDLKGDFGSAVVGSVSGIELGRLHKTHGNRLFEGNLRLFVGQRKGGINEKIIETAESRPGDFWALNNGITIVADSFERISEQSLLIKGFSIVNGCQTTVCLSTANSKKALSESCQVLVRVVAAKKSMLTDIVRYNNTQNQVKVSAVRLLDPVQESLRIAFKSINYNYAPKQEGARQSSSEGRIELDRITQYLAAMSESTVLEAVAKKAELYDRLYKSIFPRGIRAEKVFVAWLLAQKIEVERMDRLKDASGDRIMKIIFGIHGTTWGIFVAAHLIEKSASDFSKLTLSKMTSTEFENSIQKYAKFALDLYSESAINIISDAEGEGGERNLIRTKPFLEKLKRSLINKKSKILSLKLPQLQGSLK